MRIVLKELDRWQINDWSRCYQQGLIEIEDRLYVLGEYNGRTKSARAVPWIGPDEKIIKEFTPFIPKARLYFDGKNIYRCRRIPVRSMHRLTTESNLRVEICDPLNFRWINIRQSIFLSKYSEGVLSLHKTIEIGGSVYDEWGKITQETF